MLNIVDYISSCCGTDVSKPHLSYEIFYCKNINEKGSEEIYDIVIKFTSNQMSLNTDKKAI